MECPQGKEHRKLALRFVLHYHETPSGHEHGPHYDLMLEHGDVLRTWSLPEIPAAGKTVTAEALGDHRLSYLDYEGPVSGERGTVTRVDRGELAILLEREGELQAQVAGSKLQGVLHLSRVSGNAWQVELLPQATNQ